MPDRTISDKQGRPISVHVLPGGWKITPFQRDSIYQEFLREFPEMDFSSKRAREWMKRQSREYPVSATRVRAFISEAVATRQGRLPKSEHWDWWVGCSIQS
jgi:hypothetical protein